VATSIPVRESDMTLRAGQLVEVCSAEEIMETLDENGELESLPFMPEMLKFCGRQFVVGKVANKLCDTIGHTGIRKMTNAVHLNELRCDGSAHGGCEAACLIYWKTSWLRPVNETAQGPTAATEAPARVNLTLTDVSRRIDEDGTMRYRCQATEILRAAPERLPARDLSQYIDDVRFGNVGPGGSLRALLVGFFNRYQYRTREVLPPWLQIRGGRPWGFLRGRVGKTPTAHTDLQPGELVRIKSKQEIEKTLNADLLNRGLGFHIEMARFCGRTARVARRVNQILDEKTGRMINMKSPCIVLEGIVCEGVYTASCPRAITAYWREIWLDRVEEPT
jgi:hypothetical protein